MAKTKKTIGTKKDRFEMLIEDFQSNLSIIAEQSVEHTKRFDRIEDTIGVMRDDIGVIKMDIEFIKHEPRQKIDRTEFAALEKRLSLLENKVAHK